MKEILFPDIKTDKYYLIYGKTDTTAAVLITSCTKIQYIDDNVRIHGIPYSRISLENTTIIEDTCGYDETTPDNRGRTGFLQLTREFALQLSVFELDDDEIFSNTVVYEV